MSWPIELRCGNCDFFAPASDDDDFATCRRNAPVEGTSDPVVLPTYWCGEWKGAFLAESPFKAVTP